MDNRPESLEFGFAKEKPPEKTLASEYFKDGKGIPEDPAAIRALESWADAWGAYEVRARGGEDESSDEMTAAKTDLDAKTAALRAHLPGLKVHGGDIAWDGGRVLLWINKD